MKTLAFVLSSITVLVALTVTPQGVRADELPAAPDGDRVLTELRVVRVAAAHPKFDHATQWPKSQAKELTFGLSARQRHELYGLTRGQVDLRYMYLTPAEAADEAPEWAQDLGPHATDIIPPHYGAPVADPTNPAGSAFDSEIMDPDLLGQWWVGKHRMNQVWQQATGKGVTIADCDTGFYVSEGDLRVNLDLEHARDFSDTRNPMAINDGKFVFHGTAVAALIAGVRDDRGTNGIAFNAKLVPLQYFNFDAALDRLDKEEATARCILHAIKVPSVRVIVVQNQTLSGSAETFAGTREAVRLALMSGVTVVAAAGNSSLQLTAEERDNTGSIIVGALNADGSTAAFSNYGRRVSVATFGERLYTLYGPQGRMDTFGGTTAAAAQVAATVALMLEVNPKLTNQQVKSILERTAVRTEFNRGVGGQLSILDAVTAAKAAHPEREVLQRQMRLRSQVRRAL